MSRQPQISIASSQIPRATANPSGLMLAWLIALLVVRWLQPTEGSIEGLTLWMLPIVFATALVRSVVRWRFGDSPGQVDVIDALTSLLALAHVLSASSVVLGVGNGRAAMNVAWEWIGSATLIWMLRQELRPLRLTRELCVGLSITVTVLAGYGLYQHYFGYERLIVEFNEMTAKRDELEQRLSKQTASRVSADDVAALQELNEQMRRQGIPTDRTSRLMYNKRLKDSREPLGLFALANSFAALLLVMFLILLSIPRSSALWRRAVILGASVVGLCLVLSKSRTAWVGLIVGLAWWSWRTICDRRNTSASHDQKGRPRASLKRVLLGLGLLVVGVIGITMTGGLDRYVLTEAEKSLRYRLEYWQGTWLTILDHFWLGTGPGNFREYYLHHKLPRSSEEILDPHNMLLDVWANAGVLAFAALLSIIVMMYRTWTRPVAWPVASDEVKNIDDMNLRSPAVWGPGMAFPLSVLGHELLSGGMDDRMLSLGSLWWLIWGMLFVGQRFGAKRLLPRNDSFQLSRGLEAANVALLVHLLGAGGIAMPAITQLLCLVWFLRADLSDDFESNSAPRTVWKNVLRFRCVPPFGIQTVASGLVLGLCLASVTWPDLWGRTEFALGDAAAAEGRDPRIAERHYLAAIQADPLAIEPLDRLADIAWMRCQQSGRPEDFETTVRLRRELIARMPFSSMWHRRLGQNALTWFDRTNDPSAATLAAESFQAAVERYPNRAELVAEWATALAADQQHHEATKVAQKALKLEAINRKARHSDKYLTADIRKRMEKLAAGED